MESMKAREKRQRGIGRETEESREKDRESCLNRNREIRRKKEKHLT